MSEEPRAGFDVQSSKFWAWCRHCDTQAEWFTTSAPALRWLQHHDTECEATA